ncbi:lysophospholipase [Methylopila jiangsuensis]|uniref:Lysophospholipase n=1 Tax=Methylopila jiangsuensis TaxID=586230 RepID=A0A9W6N291_9HYPH|nr:alpha/beta hydrolase [Methylopila jiangsuensis]MDR6287415.1 lysophospholipase [Methylopila jiangsuensis]GLK74996.1 lysophospholipase [Methylopila jiangsuensis]
MPPLRLRRSGPAPRAAREDFVLVPDAPFPDAGAPRLFRAADGVALRAAFWKPAGALKGTVCLFQGRAEFIEKYGETVADLMARGFAVATFDFRGQGGSQRLLSNPFKGHVADFGDYRLDAEAFMREIVLPHCPPPYYALGHSMSAPVLVALALRQPQWFERMVLAGPMIGLPLARAEFFARGLATGLGRIGFSGSYIPSGADRVMALKPFEGNRLTSDAARYARSVALITKEPALALGSPTIGWVHAAFRAMTATALAGVPERLRTPTLAISAGRDRIVDPLASERFADRIRCGGKLRLAGARHEILMERDELRDLFWAAFDAFVPGRRELA